MVSPSKGSFAAPRSDGERRPSAKSTPTQSPSKAFWWLAVVGAGALLLMGVSLGDAKVAPAEKGTVVVAGD